MTVVTGFAAPQHIPSPQAVAEAWGDYIDVRAAINDDPDNPYRGDSTFVPDRRENRSRGEDWPIFRTEHDLANVRALGDFFAKRTGDGVGLLDALSNYTFGKGFKAIAQAAEGATVGQELLATVNACLTVTIERNCLNGQLDREVDRRARRHGEAIYVIEAGSGGIADVRIAEPSQLTEPLHGLRDVEEWVTDAGIVDCCSFVPSWSFGVLTRDGRHDKPLAYHFVWNVSSTDWDVLPAHRVVHVRRNVDSCVKRGVSDFYSTAEDLLNAAKVLKNTATGSALQAAIAWIEEFVSGTSKDGVQRQVSGTATGVSRIPSTGGLGNSDRQIYTRRIPPGFVPKISEGKKYIAPPLGADRISHFIEIVHACLRRAGVRWGFPEYIITGDASNGNYSSLGVAESPFVKARETDQQFYASHYRDLLWKCLRVSFEAGRFQRYVSTFEELQGSVFLKIDPPRVATRDELKAAQTDEILCRLGAKSVKTVATDNGLDYQAEVDAGAKPQLPVAPFGGPGAPGQPSQPGAGGAYGGAGMDDKPGKPASGNQNTPPPPQASPVTEAMAGVDAALRKIAAKFQSYP